MGVSKRPQHYIGNEQETNRNPTGGAESVSSNIDDKTMHELYLWSDLPANLSLSVFR
jgi:beta-glucosidase